MNTVKDFLHNDFTDCYKIDKYGEWPASNYEIEREENIFYISPLLSFGDYDHSCHVERSNVRVFLQEFGNDPSIIHHRGAYGSEWIGININCSNEGIIEALECLADYPCLNEEDCSLMEIEMQEEAWKSFGERDFEDQLEKQYFPDECVIIENSFEIYRKLLEEQNKNIEIEMGGNVYFPEVELPEVCPSELIVKVL